MAQATLWIVNADPLVSQRWERLLREEGWPAARTTDVASFVAQTKGAAGLALIDIACLERPQAGALASAKSKTAGVSLILTSGADLSNDDIIRMLEAGADDYFPHSLHPSLFAAKVKAHLRRLIPASPAPQGLLKAPNGDLKLDRSKRELWTRGTEGKWVQHEDLTPTEFTLLALFLEQPGVALERGALLDAMKRGQGDAVWPGTVDKHIESLRRKLGKLGARIKSIYGVGYAYREKG